MANFREWRKQRKTAHNSQPIKFNGINDQIND